MPNKVVVHVDAQNAVIKHFKEELKECSGIYHVYCSNAIKWLERKSVIANTNEHGLYIATGDIQEIQDLTNVIGEDSLSYQIAGIAQKDVAFLIFTLT